MKTLLKIAGLFLFLSTISLAEIDSDMDIFSQSAATSIDGTAGFVNPAGLGYGYIISFRYMHSYPDSSFKGDNGFLLSTRGSLVSIQWMRHTNGIFRRKYLVAAGKRLFPNIYWGLSYAWFGASNEIYRDEKVWKIGFLYTPQPYLSVGLTVDDLNAPTFGGIKLNRLYTIAAAFRFIEDRATFSVDSFIRENENIKRTESLIRLEVMALSTMKVVAHYQTDGLFQVGLAFQVDHIGVGSGTRFSKDDYLGGNFFYNQEPVTSSRYR